MRIIRCRLNRLIKTSICATLLISLVYVISLVVITVKENQCSNEESLHFIEDLCEDYKSHRVEGRLCEAICESKDIIFQKCANYRGGKVVLLAQCNGRCQEGKNVKAVIKTRRWEGHHFEPLNLGTHGNKSLTADSLKIAKTLMNDLIYSTTKVNMGSIKDIFEKLWEMDFTSFVKSARYPGADNVVIESLWKLLNQDEYLFMSVNKDSHFIPKIYGTCGGVYVMEYAPSGENLNSSPSIFTAKKGGWVERASIALQILDICQSLDIDFHEPLHFCDVKEENFGLDSKKQVKIIDTDSLFYDTSMMKDLGDPKCKSHQECDFFDCRGWCDIEKEKCVPKRTNNNLQNVCEDIFIPRAHNFYTGLLFYPPDEIAAELKQLLEECAYPNRNKGEIVRTPTPTEVFWKLVTLLKRSKHLTKQNRKNS